LHAPCRNFWAFHDAILAFLGVNLLSLWVEGKLVEVTEHANVCD